MAIRLVFLHLPQPLEVEGAKVQAEFASQTPIAKAELHYTTDAGPWKARTWKTVAARVAGSEAVADLPPERPLTCFLNLTDNRDAVVSTPHVVLEKAEYADEAEGEN